MTYPWKGSLNRHHLIPILRVAKQAVKLCWGPLGSLTPWWGKTGPAERRAASLLVCPRLLIVFAESQLFQEPSEGSSHSQPVSWNYFSHPRNRKITIISCVPDERHQSGNFSLCSEAYESVPCTLKTSGNLMVYGNTVCHTEVIINPHPFSSSGVSWSPRSRNIWSWTLELQVILSKHFPACLTLDSLCWPMKQSIFQIILFSLCDWSSLFSARRK